MGIVGVLLILFILAAVIEVLSVALKLTGLDIQKARFQIISIITSTGFTTKESELISQHPTRRKIAQIIMLISYIGDAAIIGFVLYILQNKKDIVYSLMLILVLITIGLGILRKKWMIRRLEAFIEKQILKGMDKTKKYRTVEEVLKLNDEYGVVEIVIEEKSRLIGKTLKDATLTEKHIQVLNVDRGSHIIHFPSVNYKFKQGDKVIVYGQLKNIRKLVLD